MAPVAKKTDGGGVERTERKLSFKARDPEGTKEQLLKSAIEEFAEYGFLGARVERIALRSDVTMRMLYHYYKSKDYLYGAVLDHVFSEIAAAEQAFDLGPCDPEDGMRKLVGFTFDHFARHPHYIQLVMGENLLKAKHLKRSRLILSLNEKLQDSVRQILTEGQNLGSFRSDADPTELGLTIFSLCWTHLSNRYTLSGVPADLSNAGFLEARREHVKRVVLGYLRP